MKEKGEKKKENKEEKKSKIFYSASTRLDAPPYERIGDGRYTYFINIHGKQKRLRKGVRSLVELFKGRGMDAYSKRRMKEMNKVRVDEEWKDMYAWMMDHDDEVREEERQETAKDMLKDKEPLAKIIKYSRLTEKKIRELAEAMKVTVV